MRWQWYLLVGLHVGLELITRELIKLFRGRPADADWIMCAREWQAWFGWFELEVPAEYVRTYVHWLGHAEIKAPLNL